MREAGPVRGRQRVCGRGHHPERLAGRQRPGPQPLAERRPGDQVADQVRDRAAIGQFRLAKLPDLADAGIGELQHGARHQPEPGLGHGVARRVRGQRFDRHLMARNGVGSPPYPAGTPGPERLDKPESAPHDRCRP